MRDLFEAAPPGVPAQLRTAGWAIALRVRPNYVRE
jgi:hypothetical protein